MKSLFLAKVRLTVCNAGDVGEGSAGFHRACEGGTAMNSVSIGLSPQLLVLLVVIVVLFGIAKLVR